MPYPIIIHGPKIRGIYSTNGVYYEYEVTLHALTEGDDSGLEEPILNRKFAVVTGDGWGPIETGWIREINGKKCMVILLKD